MQEEARKEDSSEVVELKSSGHGSLPSMSERYFLFILQSTIIIISAEIHPAFTYITMHGLDEVLNLSIFGLKVPHVSGWNILKDVEIGFRQTM